MSQLISKSSKNAARSAMNRLIIDCHDEITALDVAVKLIPGAERASRLQRQARHRHGLRDELAAGVAALDGVPGNGPSFNARLASSLRYLKRALTGTHVGDVYEACARATARTAQSCAAVLDVELSRDLRVDLERQYQDIELDRKELRRLRWGATPTAETERSVRDVRNVREVTDAGNARFEGTESDETAGSLPKGVTVAGL